MLVSTDAGTSGPRLSALVTLVASSAGVTVGASTLDCSTGAGLFAFGSGFVSRTTTTTVATAMAAAPTQSAILVKIPADAAAPPAVAEALTCAETACHTAGSTGHSAASSFLPKKPCSFEFMLRFTSFFQLFKLCTQLLLCFVKLGLACAFGDSELLGDFFVAVTFHSVEVKYGAATHGELSN